MPTIIDELVVKLGLDPRDFEAGQKRASVALNKTKTAAKEGSKEVSEGAGDMLKAFSGLQGKLLGVAALFTGGLGLAEFSRKMAATTTQVTYLAKQIGVSAQELEALDAAGAKVGANAGEISGSIAGVYRQLKSGELHSVSRLQSYFQAMTSRKYPTGIPLKNLDGSDRSPTSLFGDVADWGKGQKDKALTAQLWSEMGLSPGAINLLLQGGDVFRREVEKNKRAALSDADRKKFEDLNSSFHQLAVDADRLGRAIALDLLPGVKQFIELIDEIVTKIKPASPEQVQSFTDKHLPEMVGGPKSIFGRIKNWWSGGKSANAETAAPTAVAAPSSRTSVTSPVASGMTAEARGLLDTIAGSEANTRDPYNLIVGGGRFSDFSDHPRRVGVVTGNGPSTAAGRYQFTKTTWDDSVRKWGSQFTRGANGKVPFTPENQDRMAWLLAQDRYRRLTGRDLQADLQNPSMHQRVLSVLSGEWTSLPGGIEPNSMTRSRHAALQQNIMREGAIKLTDVFTSGAPGIIPHPGLMALQGAGNVSHNNTTSSTSIKNLIVNTPTNDPYAHAADVRAALERNETMNQANQGPN